MPKKPTEASYEGRPVQWSDLSSEGQEAFNENMRQWGRAKATVPIIRGKLKESKERAKSVISDSSASAKEKASAERTLAKKESALKGLSAVSPHLKNPRVTLDTAAERRVALTRASAQRANRDYESGMLGGSKLRAAGVGWYFDHRADLNKYAKAHNIDEDRMLTAAAVMSPQNSPDNEKAAAGALAQLHSSNPTINLSSVAQKHIGVNKDAVSYADLTPEQAGKLGSPEIRSHVTGVDKGVLEGLARGGTHDNVAKAIHVIRGNISTDEAIDPHSSPKVWSYRDSIRLAVPGSLEHQEYLERANTALFELPGQQRLDLFGIKDSKSGILNPNKSTAEDTWQGAISSSQQLQSVPVKRSVNPVSPAKFVASEKTITDRIKKTAVIRGKRVNAMPDDRINPNALIHAWHNEATIRAARRLSRESGEIIPSTLPQETGWTEARRVADKDKAYRTLSQSQFGYSGGGTQLPLF